MNAHVAAVAVPSELKAPVLVETGAGLSPAATGLGLSGRRTPLTSQLIVLHCQGVVFPTRRHGCCRFISFWLPCRVSLVVFPEARNKPQIQGYTHPSPDPHPTRRRPPVTRGDAAPSRPGPATWHRRCRCVCPTPDGP